MIGINVLVSVTKCEAGYHCVPASSRDKFQNC